MPLPVQSRLTFTLNWNDSAHYGTLVVGDAPGCLNTIKIVGTGFAADSKIELYDGSSVFTNLDGSHEYFYGTPNPSGTQLTASFLAKHGGSSVAPPLASGTFLVIPKKDHDKDEDEDEDGNGDEDHGHDRPKRRALEVKLMITGSGGMVTVTTTVTNFPSGDQPFGYCRVLEVPEEPSPA